MINILLLDHCYVSFGPLIICGTFKSSMTSVTNGTNNNYNNNLTICSLILVIVRINIHGMAILKVVVNFETSEV